MDKQEAIKILKEFHDTSALFSVRTALETVFPELKEDEDEMIRKTLIKYFNVYPKDYYGELKKSYIIAWLEKQGEKKVSYTTIVETGDGGINALVTRELPTDGEQKPIEWKDSDEKYLFWALLSIQKDIAASEINGVNTKDLNDCVKWLYSLKQRIGG